MSSQGQRLFHVNLLSYHWLHLPRYHQRAPRRQQRPARAPRHRFRDLQPLFQYFFLALLLLYLLGLILNIQACLPKHRQEYPGQQTSCLPVSGWDFQLHYLQGFSDILWTWLHCIPILTWRPSIAKYAATGCHREVEGHTSSTWAPSREPGVLLSSACVSAEPTEEGRF